jgi:predicted alpha/beta-hydrolase family hydrolase
MRNSVYSHAMSIESAASHQASMMMDGAADARVTVVLAHGAGAPMDHPFMNAIAEGIAGKEIRVARFEFPYMAARRDGGKRRAPDREPMLMQAWREVVSELGAAERLVIGGKSMGGRIASQVAAADSRGIAGVVMLGYPLHPPGRPDKPRTKHLPAIKVPMLFVQGSRDAFGTPDELRPVMKHLTAPATLYVVEGGDHSFKVPKKGPVPQDQVYDRVFDEIVNWVHPLKASGW